MKALFSLDDLFYIFEILKNLFLSCSG